MYWTILELECTSDEIMGLDIDGLYWNEMENTCNVMEMWMKRYV